jgi:hypothetical protein
MLLLKHPSSLPARFKFPFLRPTQPDIFQSRANGVYSIGSKSSSLFCSGYTVILELEEPLTAYARSDTPRRLHRTPTSQVHLGGITDRCLPTMYLQRVFISD